MRKTHGFTLLEILVVLAILGMGMAIISSMMRNSAEYSARVEEDTAVQLTCDNMMSSILSGNMTATLGVELPIPDAPNWTVKTELLDGPIESVVAVRITAQRYDQTPVADPTSPEGMTIMQSTTPTRTFVVKEWARRADVHTRVVSVAADGSTTAVNGTGETVASDLGAQQGNVGGALGLDSGMALESSNGLNSGASAQGIPGSLFDSFDSGTMGGSLSSGAGQNPGALF